MSTCTLPARVPVCFFSVSYTTTSSSVPEDEELCTIERNKWKGVGQEESLIGSAYYYYYTCIK